VRCHGGGPDAHDRARGKDRYECVDRDDNGDNDAECYDHDDNRRRGSVCYDERDRLLDIRRNDGGHDEHRYDFRS
jgi:hypothetical protein